MGLPCLFPPLFLCFPMQDVKYPDKKIAPIGMGHEMKFKVTPVMIFV